MGNRWLMENCKLAQVIFIPEGKTVGFATRTEVNGKRGYQVTIPSELWTPEYIKYLSDDMIDETTYYAVRYYEQGLPKNIFGELYFDVQNRNTRYGRRQTNFYMGKHPNGEFLNVESPDQVMVLLGLNWADELRAAVDDQPAPPTV